MKDLILALEDWARDVRDAIKLFPRDGWKSVPRDYVGTLYVNISSLRSAAEELEGQLKAYLDATR